MSLILFIAGLLLAKSGATPLVRRQPEGSPTADAPIPSSTLSTTIPTAAAAAASAAATTAASGSSDTKSTPFLYFIALGLGIVFTNLWVILGLKYCCRNRRRRMLEAQDAMDARQRYPDDGVSPHIGMDYYSQPLFGPPHAALRVRREKRVMKLSDLNTRFPVQKYSEWGLVQEKLGLSNQGGISSEYSLQPSSPTETETEPEVDLSQIDTKVDTEVGISQVDTEAETKDDTEVDISQCTTSQADTSQINSSEISESKGETQSESQSESQSKSKNESKVQVVDSSETGTSGPDEPTQNNDLYHSSLPPEVVDSSGHTCAVCIDSIEPDHDIRALSCGHVFHNECITPWLTKRSSCCPLCKHDFAIGEVQTNANVGAGAGVGAGTTETTTELNPESSPSERTRRDDVRTVRFFDRTLSTNPVSFMTRFNRAPRRSGN